MERSVKLIVLGGLSLVVGLWAWRIAPSQTPFWLAAVGLVATGLLAVGVGIARELTVGPLGRV